MTEGTGNGGPFSAGPGGARVLVTGASRGIGLAVARLLLAAGAKLAISARSEDGLRAAVGQHEPLPAVLAADLSDPQQAEALVERAVQALGGLDGLVCAAGIAEHAAVGEISQAALARQLAVNLSAPFLLAQRAAAHLPAGGAIVFISSTLASRPAVLTAAYAASKAALSATARSMALELSPRGVRVNAVAPGVVDTDMARQLRPAVTSVDVQLEALRGLHPLGRLGVPADVAEAVRYLLCADYVTGTVMHVDGGLSLGAARP